MRAIAGLIALLTLAVPALRASAHWLQPEQVVARLRAPELRDGFGVVAVERSEKLPRLLIVRVDARWSEASPERRRAAAEAWLRDWRESSPQGVLAIVDAASEGSLVSFDANGRAHLKDPPRSSAR